MAAEVDRWRLLLQVHTDDRVGFVWGDGGLIYFMVDEARLAERDFTGVRTFSC